MNNTATKEYGRIDFMRLRFTAMILSSVTILISIISLAFNGLQLGIDFTGGTLVELKFQKEADLTELRKAFNNQRFGKDIQMSHFGSNDEVLLRIAPREDLSHSKVSNTVIDIVRESVDDKVEMRRVEFVGPQVGEELTIDGGLAVLYALICILIYVGFRFEWRFSIGSVAALLHDVLITLGIFSLFKLEFDLTVLAAILAVIGYSLNDTIVVFDRIRESFVNIRGGSAVQIVNLSLNDMLNRTLVTSLTTLLVLTSLFVFGGEIIHAFSISLIIGVFVGTYSSIYVAGNVALLLGVRKEHFQPLVKEGVQRLGPEEIEQKQMLEHMKQLAEMEQKGAMESAKKTNPNKRKATKSSKSKRKK